MSSTRKTTQKRGKKGKKSASAPPIESKEEASPVAKKKSGQNPGKKSAQKTKKARFHPENVEKRKQKREVNKKNRKDTSSAKKAAFDKGYKKTMDKNAKQIDEAKARLDAHDGEHKEFHEDLDKRKKDADEELEKSRKKLSKDMMKGDMSRHSKRRAMLNMLAKNISKKADAAEDRILLKSDKLIDLVTAFIQQQLHQSGLPMIMGVEFLTLAVSFVIDIIPIPEVGLIAEALEAGSDGVVSAITAAGPGSLSDMIESQFMPLLVKFANVFQGMAASFTCCPKKNRAPGIKLADKNALGTDLGTLDKLLQKVIAELPKQGPGSGTGPKSVTKALQNAIQKVNAAKAQLAKAPVAKGAKGAQGAKTTKRGGRRRRTKKKYKRKRRRRTRRYRY